LAPPDGVIPLEFRRDFWRQKTRVSELLILGLAIFVELRLVTDGRTDTWWQHIPC